MLTFLSGFDRNFNRALVEHNRLFHRPQGGGFRMAWPRVEIAETSSALEVHAEVPGFTVDDLTITLHEGVLTIAGDTSSEKSADDNKDRKVVFSERRELTFTRTFRLNHDIDAEGVTANVKDGVLLVVLPKVEAAKPKQIAITTK